MLFRKKVKEMDETETEQTYAFNNDQAHETVLESLVTICEDGVVYEDAFVLEDDEIYIYADIRSIHENVVQILFQLHHEWLDDPILEAVAAGGNGIETAILNACQQFYDQVLQIYLQALHQPSALQIEGFTQERHYFHVNSSNISGIGKKEGTDVDYWHLLQDEIPLRLGNKRVYWMKVFVSKDQKNASAEVWLNGQETAELSHQLLTYALNWETMGAIHTEKQFFVFMQDEKSYEPSDFTKDEIQDYTRKAMKLFEKCRDKQDHVKIRSQLINWCEDDSLAYEIFSFLPEVYCKYAYPQVEFGEKLFLVRKQQKTRELYQSQLQSFAYVDAVVKKRFAQGTLKEEALQNVLAFSANAKAIRKAAAQGDDLHALMVPGIGYFANEDYQMR